MLFILFFFIVFHLFTRLNLLKYILMYKSFNIMRYDCGSQLEAVTYLIVKEMGGNICTCFSVKFFYFKCLTSKQGSRSQFNTIFQLLFHYIWYHVQQFSRIRIWYLAYNRVANLAFSRLLPLFSFSPFFLSPSFSFLSSLSRKRKA